VLKPQSAATRFGVSRASKSARAIQPQAFDKSGRRLVARGREAAVKCPGTLSGALLETLNSVVELQVFGNPFHERRVGPGLCF
jgi:hypothetical protein